MLEGLIASDAAQNITEEDLQKLDKILMEMKNHLQNHDFDAYSQSNLDFHEVIYNASHNQQAVDMVKIIKQQLKRLQFKTILVPGRNENSLEEHRHILEALQNHDAEQAENYLKRHVENIRHTILNNYNVLL